MRILNDKFDSFGLDIGDKSIKAAHVKQRGSDFELKKYGSINLPDGIIENGNILKPDVAASFIQKLLKSTFPKKINEQYVNACLPESQTFIKLMNINFEKEKELPAQVREELSNHLPIEIDKSYIDWHIIKKDEQNNKVIVLAGAVPKKIADDYNDLLVRASLVPVSLRTEAESIASAVLPYEISKHVGPTAIIDIGATRTGFILIDEGTLQFSLTLSISGEDMTKKIKEVTGYSKEKSEKIKRACGFNQTKCEISIMNVLKKEIERLAYSVKQNNDFYLAHFPGTKPISNVILCGGGACQMGLKEEIEKNLPEIDVFFGKPSINFINKKNNFYKKTGKNSLKSIYNLIEKNNNFHVPNNFTQKHELLYSTAIGLAITNVI